MSSWQYSKSKDSAMVKAQKNKENTLGSMVKKFMEKKKTPKPHKDVIPTKLFGKASDSNTRTLAMVLRSERELLALNQHHQSHIAQLQDLCLKQSQEIQALKTAILFPDDMDSQLLSQTKRVMVIPSLQTQISCLTAQLHSLSQDLAQVKSAGRSIHRTFSSPNQHFEDPAHSLDFSSDDMTMPDSPDNLLLNDVNPCLTPCYSKTKSKQCDAVEVNRGCRKLSRSSDRFTDEAFCRSDEGRYRYRNPHIF